MAATAERTTLDVLNPATGESIAQVPNMSADEVDEVVERAKQALPEWLDATPKERSELLLALADVIADNAEELAQIESRNVGKPLMVSRDEMPFSADNLRFFAGAARNLEGKSAGEYIKGYTSMIRREPIGIVAGICPWNYPLMMAVWKLGAALVPGVESWKVGDPADGGDVEMGPVISRDQQERVLGFLDRAKGATVLTGGASESARGWFVRPTIVTDVAQDDEIVQNEVFG